MASLLEKLVGGVHKEDELPSDYAGALPAADASELGEADDVVEVGEPKGGGYKTVVEGTGAGYGELKEYVDEAAHPVEEKHQVVEEDLASPKEKHEVGSGAGSMEHVVGGVAVEGKHHHDKEGKHHTGPISKIKHKVKEGLAKVRKKKDHHGEPHSSTSSEDEGGAKGLHT